jgi:pimeloyl-ACP methyl ester carboxylesterase
MWRFLAPKLAENHTVICVDLRAYGRSGGIPTSTNDHFPYSKRAMANELVEVMAKLGFPTFILISHDRGGRVSYRMALDHSKNVERLAVFDVLPLLEAWSRADARIAQAYRPWSLLSQKEPLPEMYLLAAPDVVFRNPFGQGSFGIRFNLSGPGSRALYLRGISSRGARRRSMSNTIALTEEHLSESNVRYCIYGPREVGSTPTMQKTEGR